jgi:ribosomal protein S6
VLGVLAADFIAEKKGKVWRLNDWGLRRLAYKIKKASKANYLLMNIEISSQAINELNTLLEKDERVIRHMCITQKEAITAASEPPPDYFPEESEAGDDDDYDSEDEEEEEEREEDEEGASFAARTTA